MSVGTIGVNDSESSETKIAKEKVFWAKMNDPIAAFSARNNILRRYLCRAAKLADKKFTNESVVLDYGCGIGRAYEALKPFNIKYSGVEIVEGYVKQLQDAGLNVSLITTQQTTFPDKTFDFAVCISIITHTTVEQTKEIISELGRTLKDNGVILITTKDERVSYDIGAHIEELSNKWFHQILWDRGLVEVGTVTIKDGPQYHQILHVVVKDGGDKIYDDSRYGAEYD